METLAECKMRTERQSGEAAWRGALSNAVLAWIWGSPRHRMYVRKVAPW